MFELDLAYSILLVVCLLAACSFEFVNGFHDTANAVATVIYTNSLKPWAGSNLVWVLELSRCIRRRYQRCSRYH